MDAKIDSISAREKPPFCLGSIPEMTVFKRVLGVTTLIVFKFQRKVPTEQTWKQNHSELILYDYIEY